MGLGKKLLTVSTLGADKAVKAALNARPAPSGGGAAAPPGQPPSGQALFVGQSHEEGRNSTVTLYPQWIERVKHKKLTSLSSAAQDTEVTPVKSISSVQAKKDGMAWTKVTVYASGNNIDFRFSHAEAARFKDAVTKLILATPQGGPGTVAAPDGLAEQLTKLAALRDQGVLTDEEFAAQKARLLT